MSPSTDAGMIEITLKGPPSLAKDGPAMHHQLSKLPPGKPPRRYRGFPYGQYETDLEEMSCDEHASRWRRRFSAFRDLPLPAEAPSESLECIRQLYCPDCKQRLTKECVQTVQYGFFACCLPLVPLVNRFVVHQQRRSKKVICHRCGSNLGYWKYS